MSFFGSNNNNNTTSAFGGGFGSSNTGGFGSNNNASTGGSLFGGNTATSGGFGGFGSNQSNSSPFGASKPAFGASNTTSAGGSLFGGNTATTGGFGSGGGFGSTANTGGGFGSTNTSGGLFGQPKPAATGFGASNTGGSLFGGGNTGGGFGASNTASNPFSTANTATNTSTGFGASNTGGGFAFGGGAAGQTNNSGTANAPFSAQTEKDPGGASSVYQSITFQQPYQNKSFEELRTEDYAQGRRYAGTNGQAGGFGASTGFGNFTNTTSSAGGGLFGNNTATAGNTAGSGFGGFGSSNTGSAFGSNTNTGGGLFGAQASKPASTSLFGTANANTNSGFGSNTNTGNSLFGGGGGFGSSTNTNAGGSLFGGGNNNQQQQNKTAFGGFGSTTNNTNTGFGSNTNTGGGLFGSNANANAGGSLFGAQNNQQQQSNPFGGNTNAGSSLFGAQNKPASGGLFGGSNNTATSGGLFGAQNNQQQSNPFGASNTGSLFGNQNQNKPPGTGLFGSSANQNTSGGLFGAQNNQQGGTSLFGGNANNGNSLFGVQNKPAGGSLFGGNQNNNANAGGLSLFGGNQNQQNNTSSLFGGMGQNNQNQQSTNTNSLFGGSFGANNQQLPQQQNQLHATLTGAPYGNEQLFSSLGAPSPPVGPLATPLTGGRPAPRKTPSLLASARLNTPVYSPRGGSIGRNGGYGFSYSTYGTPGSAFTSGSLTPGASSLLRPTGSLSSALTSRLNKSSSMGNLRGDNTSGDGRSLLRPSAFSPEGTPGFQNGSVRKLKIDRSLRTDLFGSNPKAVEATKEADTPTLKKRVSFDKPGEESNATPSASNALVRTEEPEDDDSTPGLLRAGPERPRAPEMEQVNGRPLTTVPEDTEPPRPSSAPGIKAGEKSTKKNEVGDYWTKPAMKDLKHMSRQQLKNVGNFVVGREGVGRIEFGSVDLTNTPLEDICGNIVQLNPRSATVYQDDTDKPAMGKALNVPSTIYLENSWPRSHGGKKPVNAKSGREYDKHIARLKRVNGTHFLSYNPDTGVWSFKVDHFTTYGLDDDDDESEFFSESQIQEASSPLSDAPATPMDQQDETLQSVETGTGEMEDTFQFKLDRRSQLSNSNIPGGFDSEGVSYDYDDPSADEGMDEDEHMMSGGLGDEEDPFVEDDRPALLDNSVHSHEKDAAAAVAGNEDDEQDMPGAFAEVTMPRSILKPSRTLLSEFASPEKIATESWEDQLQRTMSPKKRDRQALKEIQKSLLRARAEDVIESPFKKSMLGLSQGGLNDSYLAQRSAKKAKLDKTTSKKELSRSGNFQTAMDIMDSMHGPVTKGRKIAAGGRGFEYPYPKKPRLLSDALSTQDAQWHNCLRPSFSNNGVLTYAVPGSTPQPTGELVQAMQGFVGERYDVRFSKFKPAADINPEPLQWQQHYTTIDESGAFPWARVPRDLSFHFLLDLIFRGHSSEMVSREESIWHVCSVLFDRLDLDDLETRKYFVKNTPHSFYEYEDRIRLDIMVDFWSDMMRPYAQDGLKRAKTAEEKAIYYLTENDIGSACNTLLEAKDYKLAALVAQLPGSQRSRDMIKDQIEAWKSRNDWAEFSEAVRALYSILSGELCDVPGKVGTPENRVLPFKISERFELSWQQSFALRLFFGGHQSIQAAVWDYHLEVKANKETKKPLMVWPDGQQTNDFLFDLLSLATEPPPKANFDQLTISGSAMNSRLAWQLATLLNRKNICTTPQDQLDRLTYDFAMELENAGDMGMSIWIMLHLKDEIARQKAVMTVLMRADELISPSSSGGDNTFEELTATFHIPASLVWRASALYAKARLHNPALETEYLLKANDIDAAHEVLCTTLGPQAVIEQDYEVLSRTLQLFPRRLPEGWQRGGQVYLDFVRLVHARDRHRLSLEDEAAMKRLRRGLVEMEEDAGRQSQVERVAAFEMGKVLEEVSRELHGGEKDKKMGGFEDAGASSAGTDMLRRYQQAMGVSV